MTVDAPTLQFDAGSGAYTEELYLYRDVATGGAPGLDAVTAADVEHFHAQGYLIVRNAFTPAECQTTLDALLDLLAGKHPKFNGVIYENEAKELVETVPPEQRQDLVRKFWRFARYDDRLQEMTDHPKLLSVLARLIDDEPELFQDMALFKPPRIGREKPWHQDFAYFNLPLGTTVVGVWIALDDATVENGCMQVIPGSHREGPVVHFQRRDWQICDTDVATGRILAVPMQKGDCLFFHGMLHHGTPANRTDERRRAVQFHYKPASVDWVDQEKRLAIFGSEGKDVSC
jgi:phytanoyl-CoA hydroxylase